MAVALYARVSTSRQAEKDLSIPDQLRQMRDWCKAQGFTVAMEYIESGATATDDRRPAFQQMISDASLEPSPYDAIIVHSRSRFFRDLFQYLSYERTLKRAGVRVLSITQQTSDDPAGEMASKIFSLFDEYQSKENGKHTLRAMKENARQGFFNGSKPTFGYRLIEVEQIGRRGNKKRFEIDPTESAIVAEIFKLYLGGHKGQSMGCKNVATVLNDRRVMIRGKEWTKGRVHEVLSNTTYRGEYWFNKTSKKTNVANPESEWIKIEVPAIIDAATFELAAERRAARTPAKVPPRVLGSPTLLTGLLKCGHCGAGMTMATGKSGRYRYYKCNTRSSKANNACSCPSVPMAKLDDAIISTLAEKVFTPQRVQAMMRALQAQIRKSRSGDDGKLSALTKEIGDLKAKSDRLFEAVEGGFLPMDGTLQERAHKLQARRQAVLLEMAAVKQQKELPEKLLKAPQAEAFARALKKHLTVNRPFAKQYLHLLIDEIRYEGQTATMRGSYSRLAEVVSDEKMGTLGRVPTLVPNWLPDLDSNQGPAD